MSFMAGLAIGAYLIDILFQKMSKERSRYVCGILLVFGFILINLIFIFLTGTNAGSSIAAISFLLLMTGSLVAGIFAYAALRDNKEQRMLVSSLYSADLTGGCAGSIAASLFLIPLLGLLSVSYILIAVSVISILFL